MNLKSLKTSARNAISGSIDQVLLGFQHSGFSRLASNLKEVPGEGVDMITRIGQSVLKRAQAARVLAQTSIKSSIQKPSKKKTSSGPSARKKSMKKKVK